MLSDIDTASIERTYAVANTPVFLALRIRKDVAALELAKNSTGAEIFSALENAVLVNAESLKDRALPYLFLAALALRNDTELLAKATDLVATDAWFRTVAEILRADILPNNIYHATPGILTGPTQFTSPLLTTVANQSVTP